MTKYYKNSCVHYSLYDFQDGDVVDVVDDGPAAYAAIVRTGANDIRHIQPLRTCIYCDAPIHFGDIECWQCGAR